MKPAASIVLTILLAAVLPAVADEIRIGTPKVMNGLRFTPVYLHAVPTDPEGGNWGPAPDQSDIHLEVDVAAARGNRHGFRPGAFVPALSIHYTLTRLATGAKTEGELWAMVAKDGPHYGINVKMRGPGRYRLELLVQPPDRAGFGRHTDPVTGVPAWWEPFEVRWEFDYPAKRLMR
jgi:periplasmic iron binding protein